jgi:very-short-patch-repair endonuclease
MRKTNKAGGKMATDAVHDAAGEQTSVFQSNLPLREKLDRARTELLDLSARNRLLNMPRSAKGARAVEIVDEKTPEIFRLLVRESRPFTFVAGKAARAGDEAEAVDEADEIADLEQPDDDETDERGLTARHSDTRLQTRFTPKGLQKRLLELYYDARTLEEEQGVNILFLALGALKWIDPQNAANIRHAPLILVPVTLERGNAGEKFKLRVRPDDYASNLSLEIFLDRLHGIRLPMFEAGDAFDPSAYLAEVADAVSAKPGWEVIADQIVLGFFSFAKFLMYRDLDPENWPAAGKITERPLIRGLLSDGFEPDAELIPEDSNIDVHISPAEMLHILDSDSSQALTVHEVRRGRDMVIQGPPGTGKSQTIANIVAAAVADGKRVLFVAEKMAALEVVKRRLDATGVGDACLELHSNKANKKALLEELRRSWELGAPKGRDPGTLHVRLREARDELNAHAVRMHRPHTASGLTPYQVVGQLTRLRQDGQRPGDIALHAPETWSADAFAERHDVIGELVERINAIGRADDHVWRGVGLSSILPTDGERLRDRIEALSARIDLYVADAGALAEAVGRAAPEDLRSLDPLVVLAQRIGGAPDLSNDAIGHPDWNDRRADIDALLTIGERHAAIRVTLAEAITEEAWTADLDEPIAALTLLPEGVTSDALSRLAEAHTLIPCVIEESGALARMLGCEAPATLAEARRHAQIGERVAAAPDADPAALTAASWDTETERAADVAMAVATLETAREAIDGGLTDAAWAMDMSATRATLAAHGSGFFKLFSGEWRRANRLARSILTRPDAPLEATLAILDALARGQAALAVVKDEDSFGRTAFGRDWRGERSASEPLLRLVEWVRSLNVTGAAPRAIAARQPDRDAVGVTTSRAAATLETASTLLSAIRDDLGKASNVLFGAADDAAGVDLVAASAAATRLHLADRVSAIWMRDGQLNLDLRRSRLATIAEGQQAASAIAEGASLGGAVFGGSWQAARSDWDKLRNAAEWVGANADIRLLVSGIADHGEPERLATATATTRTELERDLTALFDHLQLDRQYAFGATDPALIPLASLRTRLTAWATSGEELFQWVAYRDRAGRATALGCEDMVRRLADGRLTPAGAIPAFEMAYYEAIYADQVAADPVLGRFDGTLHGRLARDFAEMDRQRIASASLEVVRAHHARVPARDGGAVGPLGVLRAEIARKRGHMPIRKLMEQAGPAIQALKPVFMMSPLSVAQFLAPGVLEFDLLVMDEASQIQPVDALGAVARAKQVVVVGDPKQLPPTAFFSKMTSGGDNDDDGEDAVGRVADIESILGLFTARGLPMRMLRWHYRSKHQSLIAVSNRQFYENKLFIVPSPYTAEAGMGLRFHHITNGIFDTGTTRTNMVEAKIVAQAIVAHARDHPDLSLGVAAFSSAQRRAIVDQLELLRRALPPEAEAFFQAHHAEPFFVKNLENVQGDERDVIFISVGYGPTVPGGRVPMRFGPLGTDGGERRLNVLISRAKQRCEVFASMTDEDIDPDFASTRKGVFAFRLFLHFARTGRMTIAESTGRDHDSVFEEQVAIALQARGLQVHRQVGLAGFYIDLAVADPDRPGRYLLGIECDGASYHSAKSARDRDRLRQSVLESHGWSIHRVWSTDWFQRPAEQLDLIIARVEAAKSEHDAQAAGTAAKRAVPFDIVTFEREDVTEIGLVSIEDAASTILPYIEAVITRPAHIGSELHDAPRGILSGLAEQVVDVEGPVHIDEVVARIRAAWGLKRAGGRIQTAIEQAVDVSVRTDRLVRDGDFLSIPGREPRVRDRSVVTSATLRRCEALPPAELERAVLDIVRTHFGAADDQIALAVSRAVGFKSTSAQLRTLIADIVTAAIAKSWIDRKNGVLVTGAEAPITSPRVDAPSPLAALVAEGEHERLEFKETLRWDVAAAGQNKKLEDVAIKTLAGFANRVGGTLLIGVTDDGTILGLDRDYSCLGGNRDRMQLHLTNLVTNHFGQAYRAARIRIGFPEHEGTEVCRIDIDRSPSPVFVTTKDAREVAAERFFVRSGNSTQELSPSQTAAYIREHF